MSENNLKRHVIDHLAMRELDISQLRRLESIQRRHEPGSLSRHIRWIAVAASLFLVAGLTFLSQPFERDMALQIADEVVANHLKRRPLEVRGSKVDELQGYFEGLDFRLIQTSLSNLGTGAMLGGRYCSIQGVSAAQIRLQEDPGATSTLFQAPYDAELFGELPDISAGQEPLRVQARGMSVEIWVEKGLILALARE